MHIFLYRLEANGPEFAPLQIVLVEESDEGAFKRGESLVRRQFLTDIQIRDLAIVEKKPLHAGSGYVIAGDVI